MLNLSNNKFLFNEENNWNQKSDEKLIYDIIKIHILFLKQNGMKNMADILNGCKLKFVYDTVPYLILQVKNFTNGHILQNHVNLKLNKIFDGLYSMNDLDFKYIIVVHSEETPNNKIKNI